MAGELIVEKIENGTVIDHIPAGMGLKVLSILKVDAGSKVALLMNVASKRLGSKDIVKISEKKLDENEVNRIALVAPNATLNIIQNGTVVEKNEVRLPKSLYGVANCPNPKCITNNERVKTHFTQEKNSRFRCHYCEMLFDTSELSF